MAQPPRHIAVRPFTGRKQSVRRPGSRIRSGHGRPTFSRGIPMFATRSGLASTLALASVLAFSTAPARAGGSWTVVDIGANFPGGSDATSINDLGQVVGVENGAYASETHAWIYDNGTLTDLGTLGGTYAYPYAINNSGQIVGQSSTASGAHHAFLYQSGTMTDLGTFGASSSYAVAINNSGQIVINRANQALLYSNGTATPLGTLGGAYTTARAINDAGQISGYSQTNRSRTDAPGNLVMDAFLYGGGQMQDAGAAVTGYSNYGYGMNNAGQIVGWTIVKGNTQRAFLLSGGTATLIGGNGTAAYGINDQGQVVGYNNATSNGFLYSNGKTTNLDTLKEITAGGWDSVTPVRINNMGQIVGRVYTASGVP